MRRAVAQRSAAPGTAARGRVGERRTFSWPLAAALVLALALAGGGVVARRADLLRAAARRAPAPTPATTVKVVAEVTDSLHASARRAGVPPAALTQLVGLLSWGVDLQRDVRPGDQFELLVERAADASGRPLRHEGVAYAALQLRDRRVEAYRFAPGGGGGGGGDAGYFDREGRSLRRWLLRTPIDGARLSSTFGRRRHPVLGYTRMHKGVDFAAPTGTPVLAAADGEVEMAGRNGGYGIYVRLRHEGAGFSTAYAHLSRLAPGIEPGRRVQQGDVIGRVGTTGMSTGPHLHHEVLKAGAQVDPLTPGLGGGGERLAGAELRRFSALRRQVDAIRAALVPTTARMRVAGEGGG